MLHLTHGEISTLWGLQYYCLAIPTFPQLQARITWVIRCFLGENIGRWIGLV